MIILIALTITSFVIGAFVGATHASTVTNAIDVIKTEEKQAEAVLAQIMNHKNS